MNQRTARRLLFPTSFSDACYRTIPALSEWMDNPEARLSLLYVYDPRRQDRKESERQLQSFFAEADQYGRCERILLAGSPKETILSHCQDSQYDLIFLPASEPTGFPRIGHRSLRVSLLNDGNVPMWTSEDLSRTGSIRQTPKTVAYVMTNDVNWKDQFIQAAYTAARWNASFHLIYVFPVPNVNDGTLAGDLFVEQADGPLHQLRMLGERLPVPVKVHTSTGNEEIELPRILSAVGADLTFICSDRAISRGIFGISMNPMLRSLQSQFICFPKNPPPAALQRLHVFNELPLLRGT